MVPLDARRTVLDWMAALDIPLLLVVGGYLGTISHTLTALDVLAQRQLDARRHRGVGERAQSGRARRDGRQHRALRQWTSVIGLPRLPGGITEHPAFARIAAHL